MANNTINQNVNQAIMDFSTIKQAIINKGVSVPTGTPTSQYATKISSIQSGADVSGVTATAADVDTGKVFVDSTGTEVTGTSTAKAELNGLIFGNGTQFTIPNGVTKIRDYLFQNMSTLTTIIIPETVTNIGQRAFNGCTNLKLTALPSALEIIGLDSFRYCREITLTELPSPIRSIDMYAFEYCSKLAITEIPSSINQLGDKVFHGCTNLTSITFLGQPRSIYSTVFQDCTNLTTIRVPWQEGEVANAPWGATNATIVYNYTP